MQKQERLSAMPSKQEYTPLVQTGRGGETLSRKEQFVTKGEAYRGVALRLKQINEEISDMRSSGIPDSTHQQALNEEAQKLISALDRMERDVTEEQADDSFHEGRDILVENPLYEAPSEVEAFEESFLGPGFTKQEKPKSPSQLKAHYEALKKRNDEITQLTKKLEGMEQTVIAAISVMHHPSQIMREDLKRKQGDALMQLTQDFSAIDSEIHNTAFVEAVNRKRIQDMGFPDMLNTISEALETLSKEKTQLLGDMSATVDRLNAFRKQKEAIAKKQEETKRRAAKDEAAVDVLEEHFMKSDADKLEEEMLGTHFSSKDEEAPKAPPKSGTRIRKPTKKAA